MNIKYPTVKFVFDRKKRVGFVKEGNIDIDVTFERRHKYITTGVKVQPFQWDKEAHVINHPESAFLNLKLETARKAVSDHIVKLMLKGEEFTFWGLTEALTRKKHSGSFRSFVETRIEERVDIQEITKRSHRALNTALREFKKIESFESVTLFNIRAFDEWLHSQTKDRTNIPKYTQSTIGKYHKFLKSYINEAIKKGMMDKNPYAGFKVDKGKTRDIKYLTEQELKKIMKFETEDPAIIRARDLFVFQCYTGLAYADLVKFDFTKVEKRDGKHVLVDTRKKTNEFFYIVLLTPAMNILKKYDYVLPVLSNQKYNVALKSLGVVIHKPITSHMGRHTAATMFLNRGMSIELVAKILGHTNTKQTAEYARIVNKSVENAFDMLQKDIDDTF